MSERSSRQASDRPKGLVEGNRDQALRTLETAWDREADVIVIGSGATGLPAAVAAVEGGASVILVEANWDIGGHAAISGGNLPLGGGNSRQQAAGIVDSPDLVFSDLTDWSVIEPNGAANYRYNDREVIRAFADESAPTLEWLMTHGVIFVDKPPDNQGAGATGNSALRENHIAAMDWVQWQNGKAQPPERQAIQSSGIGLVRPLEASARKLGVQILLEHRMTSIVREQRTAGRVVGITATHEGKELNIRAKKGVIIASGGSSGNVNFRRMFDPRLTEEYCGVAGEPWTVQDASGELAAMAIGGSLWGTANATGEFGSGITKAEKIGCQYGYRNLSWMPTSPVFPLARAIGLRVEDWQDVILVNQAGLRFYDETRGQYTSNNWNAIADYVPGSYRNAANINYRANNFINAALAGTGDPVNGGGPIWAIFDSAAVEREKWTPEPPHVDIAEGFFFSANTIAELAKAIVNKYQRKPMPPDVLERTVARYNSFVETAEDEDFGKPTPKYKIEKPPFYAGWSTPVIHDSRVGLRINARSQVVDLWGTVIPGLYCGGESAGGFSMHGLARCVVQGRIAGMNAAAETPVDLLDSYELDSEAVPTARG
jgi:succinate dehydrogenase/fumarate reductase flavoprotein subunit